MNVLLLNPPGKKLYVRDYYCSKVSKANYIYQPVDLLILSGVLGTKHKVDLIDAIRDRLSVRECLTAIMAKRPDAIISLTGSVSINEDISFFNALKKRVDIPIYGSGDVLMEKGIEFLSANNCIDGIILDFMDNDILSLLEGDKNSLNGIIYRNGNSIVKETGEVKKGKVDIPIPKHEIFLHKRYTYPFISSSWFATVLTDYGCPYRCSFCIMPNLPYKYRSVNNVMEELEYLHALKVEELYFSDQTFGANKQRGLQLCRAMIERKFNFGWVCFSRADITDENMIRMMKDAGCHTIIYGVESGSDKLLKKYDKDITKDILRKTFSICKKLGVKTVGTFIIGLPEDDKKSVLGTIGFAKKLECNYASFNVYVPRMHTELRKEVIANDARHERIASMDQSGSYSVIGTKYLTSFEVLKLKSRAVREFYLRPTYILNRLLSLKSFNDFKRELRAGFEIVKDTIRNLLEQRPKTEDRK